jgi:uncharacterized protein YjbI with pentapeptide repeats
MVKPSTNYLTIIRENKMTKIYNTNNKLMFQDDNLSLKELVEKNKENLKYANLTGANLMGADLRFANLRFTDLTEADLREANLGYADLTGANLSGANLFEADLREADLREANLGYANLRGAFGAQFTWAYFNSRTILPNGKSLGELLINVLLNKGE